MNSYDVAFVLPGIGQGRPTGGAAVVYRLCDGLRNRGKNVALIDNERAYASRPAYALSDDAFGAMLAGIPVFSLPLFDDTAQVDWLFATEYRTALPVHHRVRIGIAGRGGHLVQMFEDDPKFSGAFSEQASEAFDLPLFKVVVSEELHRRFPNSRRIRVGFDMTRFSTENDTPREGVLVQLQGMPFKGAKWGLEVIEELHRVDPAVKISAFGREPAKLPEWVAWHQAPTDEEVVELYGRARVFFLPSEREGFAVPVLEALASGCITVATNRCGVDGFPTVVEYGDTDGAVEAIGRALAAEVDVARSRAFASEWTYDRMVDDFVASIEAPASP